jgi:polyribonucleotide nucleotidyltransferase
MTQLIITFKEDITEMNDYINKVISFIPKSKKSIKVIQKSIDLLVRFKDLNFVQLNLNQLSEIESNLFLIRDQITEQVHKVQNKFKGRLEESTEFSQLMKLMKYRFTYVIFHNCTLINDDQLNKIREQSEEEYQNIVKDNQKCFQLMKPYAVVDQYYVDRYLKENNERLDSKQ